MKLTKKEIKILKFGTFQEKQDLWIPHYEDDEWLNEALKYTKEN